MHANSVSRIASIAAYATRLARGAHTRIRTDTGTLVTTGQQSIEPVMPARMPARMAVIAIAVVGILASADAGAVNARITVGNGQYHTLQSAQRFSSATYPLTVTLLPDRLTAVEVELLSRKHDHAFPTNTEDANPHRRCAVVTPDCRCWRWTFDGVEPTTAGAVVVDPNDARHVLIDIAPSFTGSHIRVGARLVPDASRGQTTAPPSIVRQYAMALRGSSQLRLAELLRAYCATQQAAVVTGADLLLSARADARPAVWHQFNVIRGTAPVLPMVIPPHNTRWIGVVAGIAVIVFWGWFLWRVYWMDRAEQSPPPPPAAPTRFHRHAE